MNIEELEKISRKYEVRVDNYKHQKRTPPYFYDSLRHAFSAYFNTFQSINHLYDFYSQGIKGDISIIKSQFLDEDNTIHTLIGFERFCELYIKDLLKRVNPKLTYQSHDRNQNIMTIVERIEGKRFVSRKAGNKAFTIPFSETINRFYGLIECAEDANNNSEIIKKVRRLINKYEFLKSDKCRTIFTKLSRYRDRILHNGNCLPSLWLMDFLITQMLLPIIKQIIEKESKKLGDSMFYLTTPSGINILDQMISIKYKFDDLKNPQKEYEIYKKLLFTGHLKELGRASINMNLFVRKNTQAGYEYNYSDPKGRGKRFAEAEKKHQDFFTIKLCPCCGVESLVHYKQENPNHIAVGSIDWVKCYTCDYHIRFNAGDPFIFDLHDKMIFS